MQPVEADDPNVPRDSRISYAPAAPRPRCPQVPTNAVTNSTDTSTPGDRQIDVAVGARGRRRIRSADGDARGARTEGGASAHRRVHRHTVRSAEGVRATRTRKQRQSQLGRAHEHVGAEARAGRQPLPCARGH